MKPTSPIRLYWGENYSQKPQIVLDAIDRAYEETLKTISLYPGGLYEEVQDLVAAKFNFARENILLGHGIEGLIHLTATTFLHDKTKRIGLFEPSFFVFINNAARYQKTVYPCKVDSKVDVNDFVEKIQQVELFFLASPNTATGNYLFNYDEIKYILDNFSGYFVVDECYFGIGDQTVLDLVKTYDKLIVYRGFTKVQGLGSLRFGVVFANAKTISLLNYNHREIELDPINTFSLNVFKHTFPHFELLAKNTRTFFDKFVAALKKKFPANNIIKNVTTFEFMDISKYKVKYSDVVNYMNNNGYLFGSGKFEDTTETNETQLIELTPPPEEYWDDFLDTLERALTQ